MKDFTWSSVRMRFGIPGMCSYCGRPSESIDHVIPISLDMERQGRSLHSFGMTTYSCHFCNCSKGDLVFSSYRDILLYIRKRNLFRFRDILYSEPWSDGEINGLDWTLRSYVKSRQVSREWAKETVQFPWSKEAIIIAEEAYSIALIQYSDFRQIRDFYSKLPERDYISGIGESF